MDPSVRTVKTLVGEDQRWIGNGGMPIGTPRSIVLDRSAFDLDPDTGDFPNGMIPSGVYLSRITATGLYGPYDGDPAAAGLLFASIPYDRNSEGDLAAALFWSGEVLVQYLPENSGHDSGAETDLTHIAHIAAPSGS